jgi:hypothetical protein
VYIAVLFGSMDSTNIQIQVDEIKQCLVDVKDALEVNFLDANDLDYGRHLIKQIDELEESGRLLDRIFYSYEAIRVDSGIFQVDSEFRDADTGLRYLEIVLTEGMINQSLLTLTKAKKLGLVRIGEAFKISTPTGEPFETLIVEPGNRLKERGRIGQFYSEYKLKEGDIVWLKESARGSWNLSTVAAEPLGY